MDIPSSCALQKQEWEVRVHLETVDWAAGHVEGIMGLSIVFAWRTDIC